MVRDRELHEVAGNAFVAENRSRILDRRADVKVLRLRVVGRNEKEPRRLFIVNAWWVHEAAGTGRLERFGQLPNLETPEIIWDRDEFVFLQECDHLLFATFVGGEKRRLVRRNIFASGRIRIGQRWIGQKRLERAIPPQSRAAEQRPLLGIERKQKNILEVIVVIRGS